MNELVRNAVDESVRLKESFFGANEEAIAQVAREMCRALENGNKISFSQRRQCRRCAAPCRGAGRPVCARAAASGGDRVDDRHFHLDFRGQRLRIRTGFCATDPGPWTARRHRHRHFDERQFSQCVWCRRDCSRNGPGHSGIYGKRRGKLGHAVDYHLHVPHRSTARVQEVHIMIAHILCELIDAILKDL